MHDGAPQLCTMEAMRSSQNTHFLNNAPPCGWLPIQDSSYEYLFITVRIVVATLCNCAHIANSYTTGFLPQFTTIYDVRRSSFHVVFRW
jgi:hypothetical protein